jgi:hypothetical protein
MAALHRRDVSLDVEEPSYPSVMHGNTSFTIRLFVTHSHSRKKRSAVRPNILIRQPSAFSLSWYN